jgi:hypothetical protein
MADDGAPFVFTRPARSSRFWFVSPGEPRDFRTFQTLCEAALIEAREELLTHPRAAALLAVIGKHGREGHIKALQGEISDAITRRLVRPGERQRIRDGFVKYYAVPLPKSGRVEGVAIIHGWTHTLRTTFDPVIGK